MKKVLLLSLLVVPLLSLSACAKENLKEFNKETKQAIRDLVKTYKNTENAYLVSDFDNTTSIFDVAY